MNKNYFNNKIAEQVATSLAANCVQKINKWVLSTKYANVNRPNNALMVFLREQYFFLNVNSNLTFNMTLKKNNKECRQRQSSTIGLKQCLSRQTHVETFQNFEKKSFEKKNKPQPQLIKVKVSASFSAVSLLDRYDHSQCFFLVFSTQITQRSSAWKRNQFSSHVFSSN